MRYCWYLNDSLQDKRYAWFYIDDVTNMLHSYITSGVWQETNVCYVLLRVRPEVSAQLRWPTSWGMTFAFTENSTVPRIMHASNENKSTAHGCGGRLHGKASRQELGPTKYCTSWCRERRSRKGTRHANGRWRGRGTGKSGHSWIRERKTYSGGTPTAWPIP